MALDLLQQKDINAVRVPRLADCRQLLKRECGLDDAVCSPGDAHCGPVCVGKDGELRDQKIRAAHCVFVECRGGNGYIVDSVSCSNAVCALLVIDELIEYLDL